MGRPPLLFTEDDRAWKARRTRVDWGACAACGIVAGNAHGAESAGSMTSDDYAGSWAGRLFLAGDGDRQVRDPMVSQGPSTSARTWFAIGLALSLGLWGETASAQSSTIWSFLGIGSAQNSSDPAIAAAAQAKAAKHKIHKQKKALKYLAGMGCSPERPEVAEALLAAMSDPEEPVRYEAVMAVLQTGSDCMSREQKKAMRKAIGLHAACGMAKQKFDAALHQCLERLCGKAAPKERKPRHSWFSRREECEDPCEAEPDDCEPKGECCTPPIREKLAQLAYGRNEFGCFLERSERVRKAAEQALEACNACSGCQAACVSCTGSGGDWREMPPDEERELAADPGIPTALPLADLDASGPHLPPCRECYPDAEFVLELPPERSVLVDEGDAAPETVATPPPK